MYHVINRGVGRQTLFHKDEDYAAFERVTAEAWQRVPIQIWSYSLMPNDGHFVFWPRSASEMGEFTKWMTHTHTQRWHEGLNQWFKRKTITPIRQRRITLYASTFPLNLDQTPQTRKV